MWDRRISQNSTQIVDSLRFGSPSNFVRTGLRGSVLPAHGYHRPFRNGARKTSLPLGKRRTGFRCFRRTSLAKKHARLLNASISIVRNPPLFLFFFFWLLTPCCSPVYLPIGYLFLFTLISYPFLHTLVSFHSITPFSSFFRPVVFFHNSFSACAC